MAKRESTNGLLPYHVIEAAVSGDALAIHLVLKRYEGYIAKLSIRCTYDACGGSHAYVDEELRRRLETQLIRKILDFKLD